jgi:hypothetical protein
MQSQRKQSTFPAATTPRNEELLGIEVPQTEHGASSNRYRLH